MPHCDCAGPDIGGSMRELSKTSLPETSFSPLRHFEYPMCFCVVLIYCNLFIYICFVFDVRDVKAYRER